MQSANASSGIHCKVATRNDLRRFFLPVVNYDALNARVCQFFGFSKDSVVIKYADDEGDFVTISSDEELQFAVQVAKGILRLRVFENPHHPVQGFPVVAVPGRRARREEKGEDDPRINRRQGKWRQLTDPAAVQHRILRLTQKQDRLREKLAFFETLRGQRCGARRRIMHINQKLAFISERILRLSQVSKPDEASASPAEVETPSVAPEERASLKASVRALRFAYRQAYLQLQLHRTNLQAASDSSVPEQQLEELKAAVTEAEAKHASVQEELRQQVLRWRLVKGDRKSDRPKFGHRGCSGKAKFGCAMRWNKVECPMKCRKFGKYGSAWKDSKFGDCPMKWRKFGDSPMKCRKFGKYGSGWKDSKFADYPMKGRFGMFDSGCCRRGWGCDK
jgi:hypothetical protein